jgi:4'-phosphopantetheinyl transferase EntD
LIAVLRFSRIVRAEKLTRRASEKKRVHRWRSAGGDERTTILLCEWPDLTDGDRAKIPLPVRLVILMTDPGFGPDVQLFPSGVATAYADGSETPPRLPPEESAAVANAVESRQKEFALGRWCARRALRQLHVIAETIPIGPDRAPRWPSEVVGSITHCKGFVGAVVAPTQRLRSIGFDAERGDALEQDLVSSICTAREIAWLAARAVAPFLDWPKIIFSAKEAVHKCVAPVSGIMLDFLDVTLTIDALAMTFVVDEARPGSSQGVDLAGVRGRIAHDERFVFTCAFIDSTLR